jgi:hypothetical protein
MEQSTRLLQKEEAPPLKGALNEVKNLVVLQALALWFGESLRSAAGAAYSTLDRAVRYGLKTVNVPYVSGWISSEDMNPADRATVNAGTHRQSVQHRDHTGQVINPAYASAYKNRVSTVNLAESVREECGCGLHGCLIHPVEKTGGGERVMGGAKGRNGGHIGIPTGRMVVVGDIALDYANKVNDGRGRRLRVPVLTMRGGQVVIGQSRTLIKRSGNGKNPTQPVAYRYATTHTDGCGRKTCFGLCGEEVRGEHSMRFTIVNTMVGRTMVGLDPRGPHSVATIRAALEAQEGVEAVIVQPVPFESGVASATPTTTHYDKTGLGILTTDEGGVGLLTADGCSVEGVKFNADGSMTRDGSGELN